MKKSLLSYEKLEDSNINLNKFSDKIREDYNKIIKEDFGEEEWEKEGKTIKKNIENFEESLNEIIQSLKEIEEDDSINKDKIFDINKSVNLIKEDLLPMANSIKDKINQFNLNYNIDSRDSSQESGDKEKLHKERDKIAQDINVQNEILENVEPNANNSQENVNNGREEINRVNKKSKGNTKGLCCIFWICVVLISIVVSFFLYIFYIL